MYADGPGAIAESTVMSCAVCAQVAGATVEYRMSGAGASVFVGVRSPVSDNNNRESVSLWCVLTHLENSYRVMCVCVTNLRCVRQTDVWIIVTNDA
jgi:hypothetical protein